MKLDMTFLRSKVARRVFLLFVVCAMLPIFVLALISFRQVTEQLREQSRKQLQARRIGPNRVASRCKMQVDSLH